MSGYAAGYRLERRVQKKYTESGWLVTRFPKSGGHDSPGDVLAVKRGEDGTRIHLVECKNLSKSGRNRNSIYISQDQIDRMVAKSERHGASAFVAFSFPRKWTRIIPVEELRSTGEMYSLDREDGRLLKKFLQDES